MGTRLTAGLSNRSMIDARRDNPAYLKLDLYCRGLRLDESCFVEADGGRKILRTRAGLGSGLELILPGGLWTNVPVAESFAQSSPYTLHRTEHGYLLRWSGSDVARVRLDRKSTRLNSSHANISYAVFCLKKKNNTHQ